jgi:hypothetical protein
VAQGMKTRLMAILTTALMVMSTQAVAIDAVYLGVWAPSPQECTGDDRTAFRITAQGMSGREIECETKQESSDSEGWLVRLWCGQEGVDLNLTLRWRLEPDGRLREVQEDGKVYEYIQCKNIICDASRPWCASPGSP